MMKCFEKERCKYPPGLYRWEQELQFSECPGVFDSSQSQPGSGHLRSFHWNDWLILSTANGVRDEVTFSLKGTTYVWREVLVAPQLVDRTHCLPVFSHHYCRWIMIDWSTNKGWPKNYIITFGGLKRPAWGKKSSFVPNGPKGFWDFT